MFYIDRMLYILKFVAHSTKKLFFHDDNLKDPIIESEFLTIIENINTKNVDREGFPIQLKWEDYKAFLATKTNSDAIKTIQLKRDQLLKDSDWVLTYDNAMSLANLDAWVAYRQVLRDLMTVARTDIQTVVFPEKPPIIRK
jgi:hypothetical protein